MGKVRKVQLVVKAPTTEEVNNFLNIPEIYEELYIDGSPEFLAYPESDRFEFYGLYLYGALIGVIIFEVKMFSREIHMAMMKKARKWARMFAEYVLHKKVTGLVYANVPANKPTVINLCKKVGFIPIRSENGFVYVADRKYPRTLLCLQPSQQ